MGSNFRQRGIFGRSARPRAGARLATCSLTALAFGLGLPTPAEAQQPSEANAQETNAPAAQASDQSGDIIVVAQRRGENLQRVPIAVTAISADTLTSRGIRT